MSRLIMVDRPGCGLTDKLDYRGVEFKKHSVDFTRGTEPFSLRVKATKESIGLHNAPPGWLYARPTNLRPEFVTVQHIAEELPGAEESWLTMLVEVLRHYKTSYNIKKETVLIKAPAPFVIRDKEGGVNTTGEIAIDMPQARKATISNAGHVPWLDDTAACQRWIRGWNHVRCGNALPGEKKSIFGHLLNGRQTNENDGAII